MRIQTFTNEETGEVLRLPPNPRDYVVTCATCRAENSFVVVGGEFAICRVCVERYMGKVP